MKERLMLLVLIVAVSACSGGVDGPVIEGSRRSGGTDAEVQGEVVLEDGCLYLSSSEFEIRYPVIWPHGTSWDADDSAIVLPNGELVHEGDQVYGGGGSHHADALSEYTDSAGVELAQSCVDNEHEEVAVFNSGGAIEITR